MIRETYERQVVHLPLRTGPSPASDHPVDALLACHARIRSFMALARTLAERDDAAANLVREAANDVVRYFTEALPRHSADEDESFAPRLRGRSAAVDQAIDTLAREHRLLEPQLVQMCDVLRRIAEAPERRRELATDLASQVDRLDAAWATHLGLEESVILPAARELSGEIAEAIRLEMRARRDPARAR